MGIFDNLLGPTVPYEGQYPDNGFARAVEATLGIPPGTIDYSKIGNLLYGLATTRDPLKVLKDQLPQNGAQSVDEAGFNLAYPGAPAPQAAPAHAPQQAAPAPSVSFPQLTPSPGFGGAVDVSAASRKQPVATPDLLPNTPAPQAAPPALPAGPGVGDRLVTGLTNFNTGGNPLGGLFNMLRGFTTGERTDASGIENANKLQIQKAVALHFIQRGMDPAQAVTFGAVAAQDPKVLQEIFKVQPNLEGAIARERQLGIKGGGSGNGLNDLAELKATEAQATEAGKLREQARVKEPTIIQNANDAIGIAQELLNHKGRDSMFWHTPIVSNLSDETIPAGTEAANALALANRLKGSAFLTNIQDLRGLGQVSNIEGGKAQQAAMEFSRAQTKAAADQALKRFIEHSKNAIKNAQFAAGHARPSYQGSVQNSGTANGIGWKVVQ